MPTKYLFIAGCIPFLVLGSLHIVYTITDAYNPRKLIPYKPEVAIAMKASTLALTKETDMWRAWVGFNISHGVGLLFFSLAYLYLSVAQLAILRGSIVLLSGAPVMALIYLVLSIKYWFRVPVLGSALGLLCFVAAAMASLYA
jgi:hypothetical protein